MIFLPRPARELTENSVQLREVTLANGLRLVFSDLSNRYFGDYHRVCIEVATILDLDHPALAGITEELRVRALTRFGPSLIVRRTLERMGVPGAEVEKVVGELLDNYLLEARRYQERADYPVRLLRAELERKTGSKPLPKLK